MCFPLVFGNLIASKVNSFKYSLIHFFFFPQSAPKPQATKEDSSEDLFAEANSEINLDSPVQVEENHSEHESPEEKEEIPPQVGDSA